jgi:hypothetical protein
VHDSDPGQRHEALYRYRVYFNQLAMHLPNEGFCETLLDAKRLGNQLLRNGGTP